jgi:diadenosine tetraphosphate (Ap4A) HIT family hydrolase
VTQGLAHLWAGWRGEYIADANEAGRTDISKHEPSGCVFCRLFASELPPLDTLIVARGQFCVAILNRYPYTSGHMMLIPNRHVANLADLTPDESAELWTMINHGDSSVRRAYSPDATNVGINQGRAAGAGIPAHLHVHVVPRWASDTNFMTAIADTRIIPEPLERTHARLVEAWSLIP